MLIESFGGTKSLRKILGELKTKLKIFIETKNIFIPSLNNINIIPFEYKHTSLTIINVTYKLALT
jgi:hypothetical protein